MKIKIEEKGEHAVWSWFVYMKERTIFHKVRAITYMCNNAVFIKHNIVAFKFNTKEKYMIVKKTIRKKKGLILFKEAETK